MNAHESMAMGCAITIWEMTGTLTEVDKSFDSGWVWIKLTNLSTGENKRWLRLTQSEWDDLFS